MGDLDTTGEIENMGGNAQNLTNLIQYGSEADDFEFDEVGSTIEMSPTNTRMCEQ
jgi:hypothetical protein